jgi:hypothetical protein
MSSESLEMTVYPYLISDSSKVDIIFDFEAPKSAATVTLSNIVLMRLGVGCLEKIQDYSISLTHIEEPIQYGFNK